MPNLNQVNLMGHLARDPELKYLKNGTAVADATIAVNSGYGDNQKTAFIDCTLWKQSAEFIAGNTQKGDCILVVGEIQQDNWETQDGQKRSKLKVNVRNTQIIKNKKKKESKDEFEEF